MFKLTTVGAAEWTWTSVRATIWVSGTYKNTKNVIKLIKLVNSSKGFSMNFFSEIC